MPTLARVGIYPTILVVLGIVVVGAQLIRVGPHMTLAVVTVLVDGGADVGLGLGRCGYKDKGCADEVSHRCLVVLSILGPLRLIVGACQLGSIRPRPFSNSTMAAWAALSRSAPSFRLLSNSSTE